jgi:hypothetical protein
MFVFEDICKNVYYLFICLYLSLKVSYMSTYVFTSFRVIGCVCVFVFEGLSEGVSL